MVAQILSLPRITLRNYQQELIKACYQEIREGKKKVLLQLPTGGGKSAIMGKIIFDALSRSKRVLCVAHRTELLEQLNSHLNWAGIPQDWIGWIKAGKPEYLELPVQITSPQTWARRWKAWKNKGSETQLSLVLPGLKGRTRHWKRDDGLPKVDIILIDEAHHSAADTYQIFWDLYPEAYIIGVSATPCRSDGKGLIEQFESLVCGPSVSELIEQKYLAEYLLIRGKKEVSLKGLKKLGGEYKADDKSVERFSDSAILGDAIGTWKQYVEPLQNRRTIGFAIRCDHAVLLTKEFVANSIKADYLDGSFTPEERVDVLAKFIRGEIDILWQVGLFSEGFDLGAYSDRLGLPPADIAAVQIVRPIASLGLWLQSCGRALRPAPGKEKAYIIDHASCHERLGFPCDPIVWSLEAAKPQKQPQKKCPQCSQNIKAVLRICPVCAFEFPIEPEKKAEKGEPEPTNNLYWDADMEVVDPKKLDRLRRLNIRNSFELERAVNSRGISTFEELAFLAFETNTNPWKTWFIWERYLFASGFIHKIYGTGELLNYLFYWEKTLRQLVRQTNTKGFAKEMLAKIKQPIPKWHKIKYQEFCDKLGLTLAGQELAMMEDEDF